MADAQQGVAYTPTLRLTDPNGNPIASGVTGTMGLYYGSDTVALASGVIGYLGNGEWGYTFSGDLLQAAGAYRWNVPTVTFAGGLLYDQGGIVRVGVMAPWSVTLGQAVVDLTVALQDGYTTATTGAGTTTTLVDASLADPDASAADYKGSEVLVFPIIGVPTLHRVVGFTPASGTLTVAPAMANASATGQRYLLSFLNGKGMRHEQKIAALRAVIAGSRVRIPTSVRTTAATFIGGTYLYGIPEDWASVVRLVRYRPGLATWESPWYEITPDRVVVDRERRTLQIKAGLWNSELWIEGSYAPSFPASLAGLLEVPGDWAVDAAHARLTLQRGGQHASQQLGAMLAQPRYRGVMLTNWRANEIPLL